MKKNRLYTILISLLCSFSVQAQVAIINSNINAYNITPQGICQVNVMNNSADMQVTLEARLSNSGNERLITVKTQPFLLKAGMNTILGYNLSLASTAYGANNQGTYVQNSHTLPSGKYNYCCIITSVNSEYTDDYCEDIDAEQSAFLLLVNPADKDTIETPNPMLVWAHSEPFNLLAPGEFFKIVVAELNKDQNAESGVTANVPIYIKSYLSAHQVQYPFDAKTLEKGKRYGWQVQKIANGVIINKTEAWEFVYAPDKVIKNNKYASLKKKLDAGYYIANNNKLFFKFDEEYSSTKVNCAIYNEKRELILAKPKRDEKTETSTSASNPLSPQLNGYNRYEINLDDLNISRGMHTLEMKNEKGELFLLKFYVQ
jgi:hypothetical protein